MYLPIATGILILVLIVLVLSRWSVEEEDRNAPDTIDESDTDLK